MSDLESEFSDTIPFAQAGKLNDPSLIQLRDQIKKVMIPLLIKTFQFKLELSQSLSLPSRLQTQKNNRTPEEIVEQLKTLDNDLKVLFLWCQSCRSQIQKALSVPEEEQKNTVSSEAPAANPAVAKSFSDAVQAQSSFFQQQQAAVEKENAASLEEPLKTKKWWKKFI